MTDPTTTAIDALESAVSEVHTVSSAAASGHITAAQVLRARKVRAALLEALHDQGALLPPMVASLDDDEDTSDPDTVEAPIVEVHRNPDPERRVLPFRRGR